MQKDHKIIKEETVYRGFLDVMKGHIKVFSEREQQTVDITREAVYKNDAVAILIRNTDTNEFIFTQQFRYPTLTQNDGYLIEICAGAIDFNEDPMHAVQRECLEETGYDVQNATLISTTYVSPGYSTERTFIYYAEVTNAQKVSDGGGISEETEEIELVVVPDTKLDELLQTVADAKTLLALQWYKINHL